MRSVAAAVAVLSAVSLAAGCGSGPSQVGAAAIVGDTEVSIEYVQAWWDRMMADEQLKERLRANGQFDELGRLIVGEAVRHELLRQVAEREGLKFDEAQVSELIEKLGGEQAAVEITNSIYDRNTIRERARDQLLAVALGRKYFDTTVRFDFTVVGSREQALNKVGELDDGLDRARSVLEEDRRSGAPVGLDQEQSIGDNLDQVLQTPLFSVPAGHILAYPDAGAAGQGQWVVAVLRERTTGGAQSDQPGGTTVDRVNEGRLEGIGLALLGTFARDIGVRLNPRYGVWSDAFVPGIGFLGVAPNEGEVPAIVAPIARPLAS